MKPLKTMLGRSSPTPATLDRVWAGLKRREASRWKRTVTFGLGAAALATCVVLMVAWWSRGTVAEPRWPSAVALEGEVRVRDGARALVAPGALATLETGTVYVRRGGARLWVEPGAPLAVVAREVRLEVAAAAVRVEVTDEGVVVFVDQGEVVVRPTAASGELRLGAGEQWSNRPRSWRALAKQGHLAEAWVVLGAAGVTREAAGASLEDQTLLADIAAAGGERPLAISLLEHAVSLEGASAVERAVAAYDLGLRYVETGSPREAALAFERSLALELPTALQRDARARAAEAWLRAGDSTRARRWLDAVEH
jgi:hypothetical protein